MTILPAQLSVVSRYTRIMNDDMVVQFSPDIDQVFIEGENLTIYDQEGASGQGI